MTLTLTDYGIIHGGGGPRFHTGNEENDYDFSCLQSQFLLWGQWRGKQGIKSSEIGAWHLVTGKWCLTNHHSFICYTFTFTRKTEKYVHPFSLVCATFAKGNA